MKIFRTLPTDESFFQRYATLVPTLHKLGYLAQLVSALTEFSIIYALVYAGIIDFFPAQAHVAGILGAILGTAFLEIGLRKFTPYSVRAILHRRFAGLDAVMTVFILLVTVGLLASSGLLSFKGSRSMVEAVAPKPDRRTTIAADSLYRSEQAAALAAYRSDSAAVSARYGAQIDAKRREYESRADIEKSRIDRYRQRERRQGQSYASSISYIQSKIEAIEAERDAVISELEQKRGAELAIITQRRRAAVDDARSEWSAAKVEAKQFNEQSEQASAAKVTGYGYGLAWFTVVCLFVFTCSVVLNEVHHKGAGIEELVEPTQYDFSMGVLSTLFNALSDRWQYLSRSKIHAFEAQTPAPPLPVTPGALYDLASIEQRRLELQANQSSQGGNIVYMVPRKQAAAGNISAGAIDLADHALQFVEAEVQLENQNYHAAAKEMRLKALDVIKAYLGPQGTPEAVQGLYSALIEYVNQQGPNPFEHHHRRPIGFHQKPSINLLKGFCQECGSATEEGMRLCEKCESEIAQESALARHKKGAVNNGPVSDPLERVCDNCQKGYRARAMNQRFCSTDCRLEYHAKQHGGQRFDPKFGKRKK